MGFENYSDPGSARERNGRDENDSVFIISLTCSEFVVSWFRMTDIEFNRLVDAIGKEKAEAAMPERFGTWWMFRENCPGKQKNGCVLAYDDRPLCSKIYPFVAIPAVTGSVIGHEILLDLRYCPRWKEFGERYEETKQEFLIQKSCTGEMPQPLEKRGWKNFFRLS